MCGLARWGVHALCTFFLEFILIYSYSIKTVLLGRDRGPAPTFESPWCIIRDFLSAYGGSVQGHTELGLILL
jgi:hypothetical protein